MISERNTWFSLCSHRYIRQTSPHQKIHCQVRTSTWTLCYQNWIPDEQNGWKGEERRTVRKFDFYGEFDNCQLSLLQKIKVLIWIQISRNTINVIWCNYWWEDIYLKKQKFHTKSAISTPHSLTLFLPVGSSCTFPAFVTSPWGPL